MEGLGAGERDETAVRVLQRLARGSLARQERRLLEQKRVATQDARIQSPFVVTSIEVARFLAVHVCVPGDVVLDLGCGDGRVLVECLEANSPAKVIGVDLQDKPLQAAARNLEARRAKVRLLQADIFSDEVPFEDATLVYCFLLPEVLAKLVPIFKRRLRPTARVCSYMFKLSGLGEGQMLAVPGLGELHLYRMRE